MATENTSAKESPQAYRTKDLIRATLLKLTERQRASTPTMVELAAASGVSRSTLYRHYDCIDEAMSDCFAHNCLALDNEQLVCESPDFLDNLYQNALVIVQSRRRYRQLDLQRRKNQHTNSGYRYYNNLMMEEMLQHNLHVVKELRKTKPEPQLSEEIAIKAIWGATDNIFEHWFEDGMKETDEEMAHIVTSIFLAVALA
jgi:AcrR family transcriptional regulator